MSDKVEATFHGTDQERDRLQLQNESGLKMIQALTEELVTARDEVARLTEERDLVQSTRDAVIERHREEFRREAARARADNARLTATLNQVRATLDRYSTGDAPGPAPADPDGQDTRQ